MSCNTIVVNVIMARLVCDQAALAELVQSWIFTIRICCFSTLLRLVQEDTEIHGIDK